MTPRNSRRNFTRTSQTRPLNKMFLIIPEGTVTEWSYFRILKMLLETKSSKTLCMKCIATGKDRAPEKLLKKMKKAIRDYDLSETDEAWIVLDRDTWKMDQLIKIQQWNNEDSRFNSAISNPKFEYWLLLHFENPSSSLTSDACTARLRKYIQNYVKEIPPSAVTCEGVKQACKKAASKYSKHPDLLESNGSEVFILVQHMMKALDLSD